VFVDIGAIVDDYIHYNIVCLGYPRIISFYLLVLSVDINNIVTF